MTRDEVREATIEAVQAAGELAAHLERLSLRMASLLPAQNQFRRVEALGGIKSADRWIEIGVTRNILVHDYPTNMPARVQRANRAWADLPPLIAATRQTIQALRAEKLI